jgi:hypothetical protein
MKNVLRGFGLALTALLLTVVVLECTLRVARPVKHRAVSVNTWDPEVGTRQVPNARGFVRCPEYDIDIVVNSSGLRDREFPYLKPRGTLRILCLGDSFMCGYGVTAEETLAKVLERRLDSRRDEATWEVLNAGVGSTGTAHQLAYFLHDGWRYEPDLVVLGFFCGNDFSDNLFSGLYTLDGGELTKHSAPRTGARKVQAVTRWIPGYKTLFGRSHLLNLIKRRASRLHYQRLQSRTTRPEGAENLFPEMRTLTYELLLRFHAECQDRACTLVVLVIPSHTTTEASPDPRVADLLLFLSEKGIPHLDFAPVFASPEGQRNLTYQLDKHWNAEGHRRAAGLLCDFLEDEFLLGSARSRARAAGRSVLPPERGSERA